MVCIQGVCLGESASGGGGALGRPPLELEKQAVRILLECFLVFNMDPLLANEFLSYYFVIPSAPQENSGSSTDFLHICPKPSHAIINGAQLIMHQKGNSFIHALSLLNYLHFKT